MGGSGRGRLDAVPAVAMGCGSSNPLAWSLTMTANRLIWTVLLLVIVVLVGALSLVQEYVEPLPAVLPAAPAAPAEGPAQG
jgi:hypothetical protein